MESDTGPTSELKILDLTWYDNRRAAINDAIQNVLDELSLLRGPESFPRRNTIINLLYRLKHFGNAHYDFFQDGFKSKKLEETPRMPVSRVLDIILRQMSYDLEVIWRAANQRRVADPIYNRTLAEADALANKALQFALEREFLDSTPENGSWTVLTYLQKSASTRVIPYANVALIGVPITALREKRDYLAIAHEVGHFAYWRRKLEFNKSRQAINRKYMDRADENDRYDAWQEEIFADVYGAMVAGPVLALDFQEVEFGNEWENFLANDDVHPTPARRPLLYINILEKRGETEIADRLRDRWVIHLEQRQKDALVGALLQPQGTPGTAYSAGGSTAQSASELALAEQQATFKEALEEANDKKLKPEFQTKIDAAFDLIPAGTKSNWSGADFLAQLVEMIANPKSKFPYVAYEHLVDEAPEESPAEDLAAVNVPINLWDKWIEKREFFGKKSANNALEVGIQAGEVNDLREPPKDKWIQVLYAEGWMTDGPQESKQP